MNTPDEGRRREMFRCPYCGMELDSDDYCHYCNRVIFDAEYIDDEDPEDDVITEDESEDEDDSFDEDYEGDEF